MAYIPARHKNYNLLPLCQESGTEVIIYPSAFFDKAKKYIDPYDLLLPYGYKSTEEYLSAVDRIMESNSHKYGLSALLKLYKVKIKEMNNKENWSVVKYIGENGVFSDLTNGKYYYWPATAEQPKYIGIIDDEGFTSYIYPTDSNLWEIAEDPTGMAYNTIYNNS